MLLRSGGLLLVMLPFILAVWALVGPKPAFLTGSTGCSQCTPGTYYESLGARKTLVSDLSAPSLCAEGSCNDRATVRCTDRAYIRQHQEEVGDMSFGRRLWLLHVHGRNILHHSRYAAGLLKRASGACPCWEGETSIAVSLKAQCEALHFL
jgi:hypothetical protein